MNFNNSNIEDNYTDRELISGRIYNRSPITDKLNDISEYLQETVLKYTEKNNTTDKIFKPFEAITLEKTPNTIIRPLFAIQQNTSENQIDWVIDYADNSRDVLAFCIKPVIFKEAGVKEYWILDLENEQVIIYELQKKGFIQQVIINPRRIKVGLYNSLLLNYSNIFEQGW